MAAVILPARPTRPRPSPRAPEHRPAPDRLARLDRVDRVDRFVLTSALASDPARPRLLWWVVVLGVATVVLLAWWKPWAPAGADAPTRPSASEVRSAADGGAAAPTAPAATTYIVRPGDTLWSIAVSLRPDGDPRPVVDELAQRTGGRVLQPGQQIFVDGLGG